MNVTELFDPPLTSIDTSKMQMGTSSAEILLRAMHNQDKDIEHIVLEPKLVKRVSA